MQAIAHGAVGGLLHVHIQGGVDAQALLVNGGRSVGVFEVLPDFFDEVGREVVSADS